MLSRSTWFGVPLASVLACIGAAPASATPLTIADYGGAFSMNSPFTVLLDTDPDHSYVVIDPGDPCWTDAACLMQFDVVAVGSNPFPVAQALADLGNATVGALVGNAVISTIWHGHEAFVEKDLWTNSIEFAAAGPGVGMVMAASGAFSSHHAFTPFAPGTPLSVAVAPTAPPSIVDPTHPVVTFPAPVSAAALAIGHLAHETFQVLPLGFEPIIVDSLARPLLIARETEQEVFELTIDIKPGSDVNTINLDSRGVVSVAVLSNDSFDAYSIDVTTVCFGDAEDAAERDCTEAHALGHAADVDGDGNLDLVLHFETQETGIDGGDAEACLNGATEDGTMVEGCDAVSPR